LVAILDNGRYQVSNAPIKCNAQALYVKAEKVRVIKGYDYGIESMASYIKI